MLRVADKFGEGFVRNVLAIRGEYLYLLVEDKDGVVSSYMSVCMCQREGGRHTRCSSAL